MQSDLSMYLGHIDQPTLPSSFRAVLDNPGKFVAVDTENNDILVVRSSVVELQEAMRNVYPYVTWYSLQGVQDVEQSLQKTV